LKKKTGALIIVKYTGKRTDSEKKKVQASFLSNESKQKFLGRNRYGLNARSKKGGEKIGKRKGGFRGRTRGIPSVRARGVSAKKNRGKGFNAEKESKIRSPEREGNTVSSKKPEGKGVKERRRSGNQKTLCHVKERRVAGAYMESKRANADANS